MREKGLIYHLVAFLVVAIWGSTFISTKLLLLSGLTPAQIFTLRFIIAYILLLGYSIGLTRTKTDSGIRVSQCQSDANTDTKAFDSPSQSVSVRCKRLPRLFAGSWHDELLMLLLGISGGTLYFLAENTAMNYTTTTNTSLIVSLSPLVATALITIFYRSQRLSRLQTLGTLMAALGVTVVVLNGHFVLHLSPLGDSLAFLAALCWGFYSLMMIPAGERYDTLFVTRKVFFYGLLAMIPYYVCRPEEAGIFISPSTFHPSPSTVFNLLFLGCIASMGCFLAWNWTMKKLGAVVATSYIYFNPVTTIIFAWLILSEQITVYFLIGTLLILVGMYLADRRR